VHSFLSRAAFSHAILRLRDSGFLDELKDKWFSRRAEGKERCKKLEETEDEAVSLAMENVGGAFVVLACGAVFACLIGVLECSLERRRAKMMMQNGANAGGGEELT